MKATSIVLLLTLGTGISAPHAALFAQSDTGPGQGSGLWWGASLEAAGTRLTCDLCDRNRDLGGAVEVTLGAHASPNLRVGVDVGGWTRADGDVREKVYTAGIVAEVHPRSTSGLHLIGGVGWSGYRADDFSLDAPRLRVGAGWDLPLTGSWVAGNRLVLDSASFASLDSDDTTVSSAVGLSVLRFGIYVRHR